MANVTGLGIKVPDMFADNLRDHIVDEVMKFGAKYLGGPFTPGNPDEPLTRQIITDVVNDANLGKAVYEVLLNPKYESRAGDPIMDIPGYHPPGTTGTAIPAQAPPNATSFPPSTEAPAQSSSPKSEARSPFPVITPSRISGVGPAVASNRTDHDSLPGNEEGLKTEPKEPGAEASPIRNIKVEAGGPPLVQAPPEPRVNMNPEAVPAEPESNLSSKPESEPARATPTPVQPDAPSAPSASAPARPAPPPPAPPAPARSQPEHPGSSLIDRPLIKDFGGPDHPDSSDKV